MEHRLEERRHPPREPCGCNAYKGDSAPDAPLPIPISDTAGVINPYQVCAQIRNGEVIVLKCDIVEGFS